ncbi:rhodanese-like domain-containing protein [Coxiella burnetii]|uniref:Rhodanese-related sulfurtransferase n=1 Tax=Coxiella burnetii (strain Dugway 5J108-111) TaxID=434922 RepID=A9KF91_COXBN|nr:rhodanese-like domain-containing protein [Coxiella burnetii]ABS77313.1 rhodanese-related sulfurtransferase [Coxiella burnetii Dugway 5J108-111]ACJ17918.1 rhodanese-related sulfurtransferase [Coxiella burnetii CbuG_Q212]ACJ20872.1 rhodanese-related sulfurtransferase [Coxiella burnetii CbuK_Q154]ATN66340.1 sulfurtransferase [Coxiella burnetii]ATN86452.1 sulfurtransferase [Coxiella burnetii str. Schperling]
MKIVNIAAYKFVTILNESLPTLQKQLREKALECNLKGTILLSTEGVNLMMAGQREAIEIYKQFLADKKEFKDLTYKKSFSSFYPFEKLVVRIKKEIITMHCADINPEKETAPHLSPEILHRWYEEKQEMVILDTRNRFEFVMGTFANAIDLNLTSFSDFPQAVDSLPESFKEKPVVTFCTGGIRCEKASALMLKKGFKKVYQLDGGILNYFEKCGGEYFKGKCFVFDDRIALEAGSS